MNQLKQLKPLNHNRQTKGTISNRKYSKHKSKVKTGEGFIKEMFQFEIEPTLETLNLTKKQIRENKTLKNGLLLAINSIGTE